MYIRNNLYCVLIVVLRLELKAHMEPSAVNLSELST